MNRVCELLSPDHVLVDLEASSKKRVFERAGLLFETHQGLARSKVFDSLLARERLGSTGLGEGLAIPHGRIKGLQHAVAAVFRLREPVPFEAPDGKPISLLVFLLVPEQATQQHLEILSEAAEMLSDLNLRDALLSAPTREDLLEAVCSWRPALA